MQYKIQNTKIKYQFTKYKTNSKNAKLKQNRNKIQILKVANIRNTKVKRQILQNTK